MCCLPKCGSQCTEAPSFHKSKMPKLPTFAKVKRDIDFSHVKSVSVLQMEKYK